MDAKKCSDLNDDGIVYDFDTKKNGSTENNNESPLMLQDRNSSLNLEMMLKELGMGKFQYTAILLYGFALLYSSFSYVGFVFTAADINYRCLIPECENQTATSYHQTWINNAIPVNGDNRLSKCEKFAILNYDTILKCDNKKTFDRNSIVRCNKWIFTNEETSIASDFNIACDRKQLTFVGTLNNLGQLIGLPLTGFLADRYGRKFVIIIGPIATAIMALLRSYSQNYSQFLIFEFLEAIFNTAIYPTGFMLGIELVSSDQRLLAGALLSNFYSIGVILMGLIMWWIRDWRLLLRIVYMPGFLFALYIWIAPESVHWLQTNKRHTDVLKILSKAASTNNKYRLRTMIKSRSSKLLCINEIDNIDCIDNNSNESRTKSRHPLRLAFKSRIILTRTILCSYCWIAITLIYYGLSLNSVELTLGNKYLNFILTHLIEIPALLISLPVMKHCARRLSQSVCLVACGTGCIVFQFIPHDMSLLKSACYIINKFMITISGSIIYVYTGEMFPTESRLFFTGLCSTIGRIGSICAPQTPLLNVYFGPYATVLLFSLISISAGCLILLLPETRNAVLKSTLREIERN